ncbi:MAG: DUF2530 domain-containing protein [Dermatophilaceae bacterium]
MDTPEASGPPTRGATALQPVHVPMTRVVGVGMIVWTLALLATVLVPALHSGARSWWPWCCVAAIALGALGLAYLSRGRGNAADA